MIGSGKGSRLLVRFYTPDWVGSSDETPSTFRRPSAGIAALWHVIVTRERRLHMIVVYSRVWAWFGILDATALVAFVASAYTRDLAGNGLPSRSD